MHCLKLRFIFPIWNESRKMHVFDWFWLNYQFRFHICNYTAIECVQITETNWWKKYINSLSEHRWMFLKMLNSRGGANSLSSFFFIFMYIVPPIQTNYLLAYLLWKCLHVEIDIKIIIVILFYFITIEPTDHFGEHVFCKRTPGLKLLK